MNRQQILNKAMTEPETVKVRGLELRKISLMSCAMLSRLGNPFADVTKVAIGRADFNYAHFSEFVFIHAAPLEEVRELVYSGDRIELAKRADLLLRNTPGDAFADILNSIVFDAQSIEAARAEAIKDGAPRSKNGLRPPE